MAACNM